MPSGDFHYLQFSSAFSLGDDEGTFADIEGQDIARFTGAGKLAAVEDYDTAVFVGVGVYEGTFSAIEGQDTAEFLDTDLPGVLAAVEDQDVAYFTNLPEAGLITRAYAEILSELEIKYIFTRTYAGVLYDGINDNTRLITRTYAQIISAQINDNARFITRVYAQIICLRSPDFTWIDDMFLSILFPNDISLNSICSETYESDDIVVDSGVSQRVPRWQYPLHEADVAYGVRTMEQLHALKQFWRVVHGTQYGFLYEDHFDFTSTFATRFDARAAPEISPTDQLIGAGDNLTKDYQLIKTYNTTDTYDGVTQHSSVRPITRPQPNTVLVSVNDVQVTNFAVNLTNGIITFTTPKTVTFTSTTLSITTRDGGGHSVLSGPVATFSDPAWAIGQHIIMSAWTEPYNNVDETLIATITAKAGDGSSITLLMPFPYGVAESAMGVTVSIHPSPLNGTIIKAGYKFWIPMRFNTKRLPLTLQEYGIGAATEVKLVELRPIETL